jgi:hypothetical protein
MAYPTTKVEISFAAADGPYTVSPTWTNVTTYVRDINIRRGRTSPSEAFPSGSATLVLDNRDGRFTPWNTSGAYYGTGTSVVPRRQIQITADAGAGYVPVFRGFVSAWPVDFSKAGKDSTVTISCFDLQGLIADTQITKDWADAYIQTLSPYHYWKYDEPITIASTPPTIKNYGTSTQALAPVTGGSTAYAQGLPLARGLTTGSGYTNLTGRWDYQSTTSDQAVGSMAIALWKQTSLNLTNTNYNIFDIRIRTWRFFLTYSVTSQRYELYLYTPTTFFLYINNSNIWDNTVPHHVAFSYDFGVSLTLYVDGVSLTLNLSTSGALAATYPDGFYTQPGSIQQIAVFNSTLSAAAVANIYNFSVAFISETTSARVQRLLNQTDLNASQYSITASPVVTVAEIEVGGSVLPQLQQTVNSESGDMFVTKAGVLTFTNQNYDYTQGSGGTATAATFTDTGSSLSYGTEISIDFSGDDIINTVTVAFSGGATTTATASSSVTTNGRAQSTVDTYISTVEQAVSLASLLATTQSVVKARFSPFDVSTNTSDASWQTILGLELLSKISLTRTPSTGTAISSFLLVDSIEHQITPSQWDTQLTGSAQNTGWFVLDSSVLDGPDLLL